MSYYRDDAFLRKLGERIRELRTSKGYTQTDLAVRCDVPTSGKGELPTSQIGRIERGELNAALSYLPLIANALNVSVKDLVDFE